jgi:hypothetical protein
MLSRLKRRVRRPSAGTIVGFTALVLAVSGVSYAAIPASDGEIDGCYQKPGLLSNPGAVRVIDAERGQQCRSNETALAWNQQGPKGDKGDKGEKGDACLPTEPACVGPKGEKGDACLASVPACVGPRGLPGVAGRDGRDGAPGPSGTSRAFSATGRLERVSNYGSGLVVSKSVPAGSYVVTATISASAISSDTSEEPVIDCLLKGPGGFLGRTSETPANYQNTHFNGYSSLALSGVSSAGGQSTAEVVCGQSLGDSVTFDGTLTLIKVDSLG